VLLLLLLLLLALTVMRMKVQGKEVSRRRRRKARQGRNLPPSACGGLLKGPVLGRRGPTRARCRAIGIPLATKSCTTESPRPKLPAKRKRLLGLFYD